MLQRQRPERQIRYGFRVPAALEAVPKARRRVVKLAQDLDLPLGEEAMSDLALLAGEAIANAVVHTGAPCSVCVSSTGSRVRVEVTDVDRAELSPHQASHSDETGRGLFLISVLASCWGTRQDPAGKVTWFEVGPETALADARRQSMLAGTSCVTELSRSVATSITRFNELVSGRLQCGVNAATKACSRADHRAA